MNKIPPEIKEAFWNIMTFLGVFVVILLVVMMLGLLVKKAQSYIDSYKIPDCKNLSIEECIKNTEEENDNI